MKFKTHSKTAVGTSSSVNGETYDGFLSRHGFEIKSGDLPICDSLQYHSREISFEMKGSDAIENMILSIIPSICIEHNRYFNRPKMANLCVEGMHYKYLDTKAEIRVASIYTSQDSAQQTYEKIKAAGGQACGGYFVTISSLGFDFVCAFEELDSNKPKARELGQWLVNQVRKSYSGLDNDKVIQFVREETRLSEELAIDFMSNYLKLQEIGEKHPELSGLEGEELDRKGYELITAPIAAWLPQFEQAIESCGIPVIESDLANKIEAHLQRNGLEYQSNKDFKNRVIDGIFSSYENRLR